MLIIANGGPVSLQNVLQAVRQGRSVIVINGVGGVADEIANHFEARQYEQCNSRSKGGYA